MYSYFDLAGLTRVRRRGRGLLSHWVAMGMVREGRAGGDGGREAAVIG